jgi:hypothetical protein
MAKLNSKVLVWILVFAIILFLIFGKQIGIFSATGGVVTRTVSDNSVSAGDKIIVTYTASATSGEYGVSIIDTISGDCTFPDGTHVYKDVILSDGVLTRSLEVTIPAQIYKACIFSGDYKFGTDNVVEFEDEEISIVGTSSGGSNIPLREDIVELLNISPDTSENTANFYVILFYLAIIGIIIFLIKLYQYAPKR